MSPHTANPHPVVGGPGPGLVASLRRSVKIGFYQWLLRRVARFETTLKLKINETIRSG